MGLCGARVKSKAQKEDRTTQEGGASEKNLGLHNKPLINSSPVGKTVGTRNLKDKRCRGGSILDGGSKISGRLNGD